MTMLSDATGINFRFFQSELKDGKYTSKYTGDNGQSPNGFYKDGEIYVDINSGAQGQGLILFTVSHELTHFMRDFAPEQFDKYAAYLFENYSKRGGSIRQAVYEEMNKHRNLKYDVAYEEVVARLSESFLRDAHLTEKSKELYNTDKGLWQSIKNALEKIVNKIEKYFAGLSPESDLGKIGASMARENRDILDRFVAGIRTAADNAAYIENTTDEGGVRMMVREENGYKYVEAERNILTGDDPLQWETQLEDYINNSIRNGKDVVFPTDDGHFLVLTERSAYKLSDRHKSAIADEIEEFLSDEDYYRKGMAAAHIDELIQVAKFNSHKDDVDNKHENDIGEDGFNYYTAFFKDFDGKYYRVRFSSALNGDIETVYSIGNIRKRRLPNRAGSSPNGALKNGRKSSNPIIYTSEDESQDIKAPYQEKLEKYLKELNETAETNDKNDLGMKQSRDADYLSAVNRGDMETAQRMVDEAAERAFADSRIRGEDGKLIKVYHGTDADFTVFDRTMGRSNMDIQGLFFSPWDIDAGGYGPNVRAFYLNITNPADERTGYKALNAHKGENYAGIKAREDLEKAGYDGVNNSDEEYIAFTPEQIKSADPVTYDDNGNVIPLSQRFDTSQQDIRFDEREGDLFTSDEDILFSEYADIADGERGWMRFQVTRL